jgi:hypothetical protein
MNVLVVDAFLVSVAVTKPNVEVNSSDSFDRIPLFLITLAPPPLLDLMNHRLTFLLPLNEL